MGLVFEMTHNSPVSGTYNVLCLPSVAADLLLYGVSLELLDGDASAVPRSWVGCVLAEFNRRLPTKGVMAHVMTSLGVHSARNSEVFSALFGVHFPRGGRRCTRGAYMLALSLPGNLKKDIECDFLLMIDVEGLCSPGLSKQEDTLEHDNEMATLVVGLTDVILQNMPPDGVNEMLKCVTQILEAEAEEATAAPEPDNPIEKFSQWERNFLEPMEAWFIGALDRIITCKAMTLEKGGDPLGVLKEEAMTEVKVEVDKIRSTLEDNLKKDDLHTAYIEMYKPHFFNILDAKKEVKLHALIESSKLNNYFLEDKQLEEEFEDLQRVIQKLKEDLTSRGLRKHMQKLNDIGKEILSSLIFYDEHFGYLSRLKHMLEENNRLQRLEAHRLATRITEEYNDFFRKRDQGHRVAQAFTTMVLKLAALDYIYRPLCIQIMEEMVSGDDVQRYLSPQDFNCSLLEDCFESFLEYLLSHENFSLKRIQDRVAEYLTRTAMSGGSSAW
ncbi:unnamed protein product [Coregonus sp. 'balchen']|nr:unnamed protein product [Coregonus sp. 'balchen']